MPAELLVPPVPAPPAPPAPPTPLELDAEGNLYIVDTFNHAIRRLAADGTITLGEPATLHTSEHASFQTAWEEFARQQGGTLPANVAIAVAGPVGGEVIRFTNNPWIIRPALIPEKLGAARYTLVNDFGAVGHAVARAGAEHFLHLTGPEQDLPASGTLSFPLAIPHNENLHAVTAYFAAVVLDPNAPTGLRSTIELIEELVERGGGHGLFTGCAAGDTGMAVVLHVGDAA